MHRRVGVRRPFAVLRAVGLVIAASLGALRAVSVADAHNSVGSDVQRRGAQVHGAAVTRIASAAQQPDGQKIFGTYCAACHQVNGEGLEGTYPPLAASEWVVGDEGKLVRIILHGLTGPVEVAGQSYSGAMPGWGAVLEDPDVAAVASYVRSAWGNKAAPVSTAKVAEIRAATASRSTPWTVAELAKVATPAK